MKILRISLVALTVGAAACGESATDLGDELSSEEAGALAAAILDLTLAASMSESPSAQISGAAAVPTTFNESAQLEGPCPLGGTMKADLHVAGSFDPATNQGQLDLDVRAEHHGCQVEAKETGQRFTLQGAPAIEAEFRLVAKADRTYTLAGGYDGAVEWRSDGRSGTCRFDLDFSGNVDATTGRGTARLEGTACGVSVRHDVSG